MPVSLLFNPDTTLFFVKLYFSCFIQVRLGKLIVRWATKKQSPKGLKIPAGAKIKFFLKWKIRGGGGGMSGWKYV